MLVHLVIVLRFRSVRVTSGVSNGILSRLVLRDKLVAHNNINSQQTASSGPKFKFFNRCGAQCPSRNYLDEGADHLEDRRCRVVRQRCV